MGYMCLDCSFSKPVVAALGNPPCQQHGQRAINWQRKSCLTVPRRHFIFSNTFTESRRLLAGPCAGVMGPLAVPLVSAVSMAGISVSCALGLEEEGRSKELTTVKTKGDNSAYHGFLWGFITCLSLLPSVNWMAWLLLLQSGVHRRPHRLRLAFAALYSLPALDALGPDIGSAKLLLLVLGAVHLQVERISETEPSAIRLLGAQARDAVGSPGLTAALSASVTWAIEQGRSYEESRRLQQRLPAAPVDPGAAQELREFDEELRLKSSGDSEMSVSSSLDNGGSGISQGSIDSTGGSINAAPLTSTSANHPDSRDKDDDTAAEFQGGRIYPKEIVRPPVERPWFLSASKTTTPSASSATASSFTSSWEADDEDRLMTMESGPSFLHPDYFSGGSRFGDPSPAKFLRAFDVMVSTEAARWIFSNSARIDVPSCITVEPYVGIPMQSPHWPTPVELEEAEGLLGALIRRREAEALLMMVLPPDVADGTKRDGIDDASLSFVVREAQPLGVPTHLPLVEAMTELCRWGFLRGKGPQTHLAIIHLLQRIVHAGHNQAHPVSAEVFGDMELFLSPASVAAVTGMVASRHSRMQLPDKLGYEQFPLEGLPLCSSWESHELFDRYLYAERSLIGWHDDSDNAADEW